MNDERQAPTAEDAADQTEQAQPVDAPAQVSPGYLLRSAREQKGLSAEQLVAQTLLSRTTVEALENNQFERLSQPVFVRGYYRKCAKTLGMPEDELMQAYAAWTGEAGPQPASPRQVDVIPQDVTPGNWRILSVVLLVAAVIALGFGAWMLLPQNNGSAGGETVNAPTPTTQPPTDEDANQTQAQAQVSEPDIPDTTESIIERTPDKAPAEAAPAPQAEATQTEPKPAESEAATAAQTRAQAAQVAANKLVLSFNERSWVEVRDARNQVLLSGIVAANSQRTRQAQPPYQVVLGNAPGVRVSIGGEAVDFSDQIRPDNTARLTVRARSSE